MSESSDTLEILIDASRIDALVIELAKRLAPETDDDTVAVCLLLGGLWFAADLMRSLADEGRNLAFDGLWLSSYQDGRLSSGRCVRLAGPSQCVSGKPVLIIDDVIDSGLSLFEADRLLRQEGASKITTVVFARKPWPTRRAIEPDHFAWDAPSRFLVGYGMDAGGRMRGLPDIAALGG